MGLGVCPVGVGVGSRGIHSVHICLENLRNPGNRAAITRSMDGFGLLHLHEIDWEDPAIAHMVS